MISHKFALKCYVYFQNMFPFRNKLLSINLNARVKEIPKQPRLLTMYKHLITKTFAPLPRCCFNFSNDIIIVKILFN